MNPRQKVFTEGNDTVYAVLSYHKVPGDLIGVCFNDLQPVHAE